MGLKVSMCFPEWLLLTRMHVTACFPQETGPCSLGWGNWAINQTEMKCQELLQHSQQNFDCLDLDTFPHVCLKGSFVNKQVWPERDETRKGAACQPQLQLCLCLLLSIPCCHGGLDAGTYPMSPSRAWLQCVCTLSGPAGQKHTE